MKRLFLTGLVSYLAAFSVTEAAQSLLSDNFNSYSDGNLVGQGGWTQTSSTTTSPIQVSSGTVIVGNTGQDVYKQFTGGAFSLSAGTVLTVTMNLNVTAAQATGDYFFHLGSALGGTSGFYDKLWAKSTTGGYFLGVSGIGTTGTSVTYGTTVLNLNTTYSISLVYSVVSGTANDTIVLGVTGVSPTYASGAFVAGDTEPTSFIEANFRQGSVSAAPSVVIDNLAISAVPEPNEYGIAIAALMSVLILIRRRQKARMV